MTLTTLQADFFVNILNFPLSRHTTHLAKYQQTFCKSNSLVIPWLHKCCLVSLKFLTTNSSVHYILPDKPTFPYFICSPTLLEDYFTLCPFSLPDLHVTNTFYQLVVIPTLFFLSIFSFMTIEYVYALMLRKVCLISETAIFF